MGELRTHPKWAARVVAERPSKYKEPVCTADVAPQEVRWLWKPYIPRGMVTLIEGDPGLGKSWITMWLASAVSNGTPLPGATKPLPPMNVLLCNAEDSLEHSIVPRLISMGADRKRVFFLPEVVPLTGEGMEYLEDFMKNTAATILFIDPIVAYLGAGVDMHRANEVRPIMAGLKDLAQRTDSAVIVVRHLRKPGGDGKGKAIYRGLGSIDFSAAVRSICQVEEDDEGARVFRHVKSNIAKLGPTISYTLEETDGVTHFRWGDQYEDHSQVCRVPKQLGKAIDFLGGVLADGPVNAADIIDRALAEGISERTLRRAKEEIAKSYKVKEGWEWELS